MGESLPFTTSLLKVVRLCLTTQFLLRFVAFWYSKKQWYYTRKITHLGGKERVELWDTMKAMWKRNNALPSAERWHYLRTVALFYFYTFFCISLVVKASTRPTSFLLRFLSKRSRKKSRNAQVLLYYWGSTSANILQHLPKMVQS